MLLSDGYLNHVYQVVAETIYMRMRLSLVKNTHSWGSYLVKFASVQRLSP